MTSLNRRTLVKGGAWAAPIVLATATIPAYAASNKDLCAAFSAQPTATFGQFKLTIDADTERLVVTAMGGTKLDPSTFTKPQWVLSTDQTAAFWVAGTTQTSDPTITLPLTVKANSVGTVSIAIDQTNCESLYYNGTQFTKD